MDHKLVRITHQFMVALAPTNSHAHPSWQVRERMGRPPKGVGMPKRKKKKVDGPGQRRSSGGRPRKQPLDEGSGSERLDAILSTKSADEIAAPPVDFMKSRF